MGNENIIFAARDAAARKITVRHQAIPHDANAFFVEIKSVCGGHTVALSNAAALRLGGSLVWRAIHAQQNAHHAAVGEGYGHASDCASRDLVTRSPHEIDRRGG